MSRSTSTTLRQAVFAQETDQVFVILLTIDHDDLSSPIQVSSDNNDEFVVGGETVRGTTSNGVDYIFYPTDISLPDDVEGNVPQAQLSIDNIDRSIMEAIRNISTPPTVTIQVVLADSPDTVEALFENFELQDVKYDAFIVSGTLSLDNFLAEPYPAGTMLPSNFPGLFS